MHKMTENDANKKEMSVDEFARIVESLALNKAVPQQVGLTNGGVSDVLTKVAVAVCTAGIMWLITSVSGLQNQMTAIQIAAEQRDKSIDRLEQFAAKPRFTADDFMAHIAPLKQTVEFNDNRLNERRDVIQNTIDRVSKLETTYGTILEKLEEIRERPKREKRIDSRNDSDTHVEKIFPMTP